MTVDTQEADKPHPLRTHVVYVAIGFLLYRNGKLQTQIDKLRRDWKLDY